MSLTLRRKLLLFSALIAMIPLLFAGQSLIRIARDEMKSSANDRLVTTTREVSGQIDDIYERAWLAPLLMIRSAIDGDKMGVEEKIAILTYGISQLPDIVALQVTIDGSRLPLVISQDKFSARLSEAGIEPLSILRVAPEKVMEADLGGEAPRVMGVDYEPKTDTWLTTVVVPLKAKFGGARGVLSARIDLGRIEDFIMNQPFRQIGMITTVTKDGLKLFDFEEGKLKDLNKREIVQKALDVRNGGQSRVISVESYPRPDGTPMLGAFAFVKSFDWTMMVEQKEADAYYAAEVMLKSLALWTAGGLGIAILGAIAFSLGISRPILAIGEAANEVAKGNFRIQVKNVHSKDEIGELASRINNMIVQINERFELAKFVSHGTMDAIKQSDSAGVALGGSRREVTILFADIRGYTAFAESRDPETVVEVLNFYLERLTGVVASYNGDIDKFVGDQIMAVFQGPAMATDALSCAVAMQQMMTELAEAYPDRGGLAIGIGIDLGEVVMGAVGARHRMDFTVLGDHVNIAARLCSAARPHQTLASAATVAAATASQAQLPLATQALEPIPVKGKIAPLEVYDIRPVEKTAEAEAGVPVLNVSEPLDQPLPA